MRCWGTDRENHITPTTVVPNQLLQIAREAVAKLEKSSQELRDKAAAKEVKEQALERLAAARRTSAARLGGYQPY